MVAQTTEVYMLGMRDLWSNKPLGRAYQDYIPLQILSSLSRSLTTGLEGAE